MIKCNRNVQAVVVFGFLMMAFTAVNGQTQEVITEILRQQDSILFKAVFDDCDTTTLKALLVDGVEFYHDQGGFTDSKSAFVASTQAMCHMAYKPIRRADPESFKVYPLYDQGKLYGAVQTGTHQFYAKEEGKPEYLTSTAIFTHVWILEDGTWKLKRVLSYDHQPAQH